MHSPFASHRNRRWRNTRSYLEIITLSTGILDNSLWFHLNSNNEYRENPSRIWIRATLFRNNECYILYAQLCRSFGNNYSFIIHPELIKLNSQAFWYPSMMEIIEESLLWNFSYSLYPLREIRNSKPSKNINIIFRLILFQFFKGRIYANV